MASKKISVCGRCSREVYHAEQRVAINKVWHAFCFSCAICNKLLDSCTINPYNGEIYCTTCFQQISAYDYDFDNDENSKRDTQSETTKHHQGALEQQKSPKPTTQRNHTPDSKSARKPIRTPDKKPATVKSPGKDQKRTATPPQNKQSPKTKQRNVDESNSYHIKDLYQSPEKAHKLDKNKKTNASRPSSANLPPKNVRKDPSGHYNIAGLFKTPKKQHTPFDDSDGYHLDRIYKTPEKPKDGKKLTNSPSRNYGITGLFKTPKKKHEPFDDSDGYHLDKMYKTPENGKQLKNVRSEHYGTAALYKTPKKKHAPFDDSDGYHLDKMYQSPEKHQTRTKIGQNDSGQMNLRRLYKTPKKKGQDMDETNNYHIGNLYPSSGKAQKDQKNARSQRNFMDETDNYHVKDMYRTPEKPHRGQPKRTDSDQFYKTALSSTQFKTPGKNHRDMDDTDNYNIDSLYQSPQQKGGNRTIIPNSPRSPMNKSPKRNNNEEFYHTANHSFSPNKTDPHGNDDLYKTAISNSPRSPRNMSPIHKTGEEFYQTANYPNSPNRTGDDLYKTAMSNTPRSPTYRSPNRNASEEFYHTANYQNSPNRTEPGDFYKTAISNSPRSPNNKSPNRTNSKEFYRTANFESTPNRTNDHYKTAMQNTPRSPRYNQPHRNNSEDFFQTPNYTNSPNNTTARACSPTVCKTGVQHSPRNFRENPNLYQTARRSPKNNFNETIYESATQLSPKKFSPKKLSFESMNSDDFFHNATTSTPQRPHQRNFTVGYAMVPPNPEHFKSTNNTQLDESKKKGFFSRWLSRIIDRDKKEEKSPEKPSNNPHSTFVQQEPPKRYRYVRYPMDESEYYNNDNTYQYPEEESINRGGTSKPYEPQHLDHSCRVPENNYGWDQRDLQVYRVDKVSKPKIKNLRNPMDDTNNYNIDRLYQSPERNPRGRNHNLDDTGDYYIDKLYQTPQKMQQHYDDIDYHLDKLFATPPKHQRSPRRNPMDDTEDYNINQLYSTPPKHQRSPRRNPMDDTEDYNINQLYSTPERYKNKPIDNDPSRVRFKPNTHSTPAKKNNHIEYNNDTNQTRGKTKYGSEVAYSEKDHKLHDANRKPVCKSSCDSKNCYIPTPREISGYYSRKSKQRFCNSCFPEFDAYDSNPQNNDICKRCNRMVYIVEKVKAGGNCYHDCCFTCYICRRPLNSLNLLSRRGEIFCKHCHLKYFGPHTYGFGMLPNLSL